MQRLYVILGSVLIALGVAGFIFWHYFYLSTITIDPIPTDAVITVNGKPTPDRTLHLLKGQYKIEISAPGYARQSFTATVGIGSQITKRIELASLPRPKKLIDGPVRSFATSADRKTLFFERDNTLYFYSLAAPQPAPIVPITPALDNINQVDWSPDFSLALLEKAGGEVGLYDFKRYDLLHQEYRPLNKTITNPVWSLDGTGFYYLKQDATTGEKSLIASDKANTNPSRLFDLNAVQLPISQPKLTAAAGNQLLLSDPMDEPGDLFLFDAFQKVPPVPITSSGRITSPVLSPDKLKLAYTDSGELVVADITGQNKRNLNLRPRPGNYSFIDSKTLAVFSSNLVTLINTTDDSKQPYEIYAPSDAVRSLTADPNGTTLYYTYQGSLYQIIIK